MKTSTITKIVVGIVAVLAIAGAYVFPQYIPTQLAGISPAGSTFLNAKFAGVAINLANTGANGTSTSILNTDANDRFVVASKIGCSGVGTSQTAYTGAGLANLLVSVGTTTAAAPAGFTSFAAVATNVALSTSTVNLLFASSTLVTGTENATLWPTNTYMTFYFNATNTARCTVGVEYLGS